MENSSKGYLGSPFIWYSFSWVIVIGLYELEWTDLYPSLSSELLIFLSFTTLISMILGYLYRERSIFIPLESPLNYFGVVMKTTTILYLSIVIECIYSRSFPIRDYIAGTADEQSYQDFGVPFFHVIVVNSLLLLFFFSSYCYLSIDTLKNRFITPVILSLIAPLLFMSRGTMLFMIFGFFLVFLLSRKRIGKMMLLKLSAAFLLILYLFGLTGNLRLNDPDGEYIMEIGGATDSFKDSKIPTEFFWSFLYIATPIGNLQNTIDSKVIYDPDETGPTALLANAILPKFIGKRLEVKMDDEEKYRVVNALIVGTTYFEPYIIWGWWGMIVVFIVMMLYCIIMLRLIPVDSIFNVPLLCVLSTMTFFSLFDNMIVFMAIFPQLVLIYLFKNYSIIEASDYSLAEDEQK